MRLNFAATPPGARFAPNFYSARPKKMLAGPPLDSIYVRRAMLLMRISRRDNPIRRRRTQRPSRHPRGPSELDRGDGRIQHHYQQQEDDDDDGGEASGVEGGA